MGVQHEVLEGSLKNPPQLLSKRTVVGDGARLGLGTTLLILGDALQLSSSVAAVAAAPILLHKMLLDVPPG